MELTLARGRAKNHRQHDVLELPSDLFLLLDPSFLSVEPTNKISLHNKNGKSGLGVIL